MNASFNKTACYFSFYVQQLVHWQETCGGWERNNNTNNITSQQYYFPTILLPNNIWSEITSFGSMGMWLGLWLWKLVGLMIVEVLIITFNNISICLLLTLTPCCWWNNCKTYQIHFGEYVQMNMFWWNCSDEYVLMK